jgi:hypothetical protein
MPLPDEEIIQNYYSLDPKQYPILISFNITQELSLWGEQPKLSIEMEFKSKNENNANVLKLKCRGVRNLILKQPTWSVFEIPWIEISSIRARQWENLNYYINDPEEESISFMCAEFEAAV